jgi:hypothetical protein
VHCARSRVTIAPLRLWRAKEYAHLLSDGSNIDVISGSTLHIMEGADFNVESISGDELMAAVVAIISEHKRWDPVV